MDDRALTPSLRCPVGDHRFLVAEAAWLVPDEWVVLRNGSPEIQARLRCPRCGYEGTWPLTTVQAGTS